MYDDDNMTGGTQDGVNTDGTEGMGESGGTGGDVTQSGSQYRYSGPFYQDDLSSGSSGSSTAGDGKDGASSSSYGSGGNTYSYTTEYNSDPKPVREKRPKKEHKFLRLIGKTVVVALVFGVVAGAAIVGTTYVGNKVTGQDTTSVAETETTTEIETTESGLESAGSESTDTGTSSSSTATATYTVSEIVEACMPSLVAITNISVVEVENSWSGYFGWYSGGGTQSIEETSSGTGIIIGQNDTELLIVTNNHVISGATTLTVVFSVDEDEEEANAFEAQIKGTDSSKDVGVIAVALEDIPSETLSEIKAATIGDSSQLKVGDQVIAIGNALGYGQSVTSGIVSALDREVTLENDDGTTITNLLIQTDAAINPGNSGGALLNMQGEVIGINEAKYSSDDVEGMGYAIPISDVESIIGDLQSLETRTEVAEEDMGYLGITCQDVTEEVAEQYDMPVGVYIKSVYEGCAADEAGLQKGDILTAFDGMSITSYEALRARLQYYEAGESVEVTVQTPDGGTYVEKTVTVVLSSQDEINAASLSQ